LVEYTIRGPMAPSSQISLSRGSAIALEPEVHHDVGADLAGSAITVATSSEVEDVDRLAADLAEHHVAGGDVTDRRHHAACQRLTISADSGS